MKEKKNAGACREGDVDTCGERSQCDDEINLAQRQI